MLVGPSQTIQDRLILSLVWWLRSKPPRKGVHNSLGLCAKVGDSRHCRRKKEAPSGERGFTRFSGGGRTVRR